MRLAPILCVIKLVHFTVAKTLVAAAATSAATTPAPPAAAVYGPAVSVEGLAATTAATYAWSVDTATYPSGLSIKVGSFVGNLVISTNYTRTPAGTVGVVKGAVRVVNPGDVNLQLLEVSVLLQQPAAGKPPVRSLAECPKNQEGYIDVEAASWIACPFAVLLEGSSSNSSSSIAGKVQVQGQAVVLNGAQLASIPLTALFSSSSGNGGSSAALELGRCAVLSDTFMSGDLFLTPGAVAAGTKLPSLGGAGAFCGTTRSLYRVTFGPYAAGMACGMHKVMNLARVNPLGGDQPPSIASSLVLVAISGCTTPQSPPPPSPPRPPASSSSSSSSSGMGLPSTVGSVIFGPPAPPSPAFVPATTAAAPGVYSSAPAAGYYNPPAETPAATPAPAAGYYAPTPTAAAPAASAPAPAPVSTPTPDDYYYTYEYEATMPTGKRRRLLGGRGTGASGSSSSSFTGGGSSNSSSSAGASASGEASLLSTGLSWMGEREEHWSSSLEPQQDNWHPIRRLLLHPEQQQQQQPEAGDRQVGQMQEQEQQQVWLGPLVQQQLEQPSSPASLTSVHQPPLSGQQGSVESSRQQLLQAPLDWWQLQDDLQYGYGLSQAVAAGLGDHQAEPEHTTTHGRAGDQQQQQQQQQEQAWDFDLVPQLLVNAANRQERWQLRRRRLQQQQQAATPQPGSGSTYYGPAAVADPSKPSIVFGNVRVDAGVMSFNWQPKVSVSPAAVTLQLGTTATLQYDVKVLRTELPRRTLLRGTVVVRNPTSVALKLVDVAVEAPAAGQAAWAYTSAACSSSGSTLSSLLSSTMTVKAKGQLVCSFALSYPAAAPVEVAVFARAVTESGRELISPSLSFVRPAGQPPAAQAPKLGSCALFSDTFLSAADSPALLTPSKVPASGTKAPDAATAVAAGGKGGVVLCSSTAYSYTATLGPFVAGQCGKFRIVNFLRLHPLNGTILAPSSAAASVAVDITGCSAISSLSDANPLSAAVVLFNSSSYSNVGASGAKLAMPIVTLQPSPIRDVTSYMWSVKNSPVTASIKLSYKQVIRPTFMVQYKRSAAPPGRTLSGTVTVRNPNLLDPMALAEVQVELFTPGGTGTVARAWAACPRDQSGVVVVTGQLLGSGSITCSWSMEVAADGPYGVLLAEGSGAQLLAAAVTSNGLEAASAARTLSSIPTASKDAKPAGGCAALSNSFQLLGPDGQVLLPSSGRVGSDRLPGESGGGQATDIVCDSLSLSYGANFGPLHERQCGSYKAANIAIANPTTGLGDLGAAWAGIAIDVTGCPGAAAAVNIATLQLQLLKAVRWNVSGQASAAAGGAVRVAVGSTAEVAFGLRYVAQPVSPQKQLVGTVSVKSIGKASLQLMQLLVDVVSLQAGSLGLAPLVTWTGSCPGSSKAGDMAAIASESSIMCSFSGIVPSILTGAASLVARVQLADGSEAASPARPFDFSQQPMQVVSKGRCAIVADQFLVGPGLLQPSRSSRPAALAAATQVCNTQSVSFVTTLGPFTKAQCGQQLGVVNLARVSPVAAEDIQMPISAATVVGVNVTGGCPVVKTAQ